MNRVQRLLQSLNSKYLRSVSYTSKESIYKITQKSIVQCGKNGNIVKSPYSAIEIPQLTIDQHIWSNLSKWSNHVAIECSSTGRKYTYSQLRDHCAALAIRLRNNVQLHKNDVVAICLPNVPEYPIALYGSIEAGLKVTLLNPLYTPREKAHQLNDSNSKAIICETENYDSVKAACKLAQLSDMKIIVLKPENGQSISSEAIIFDELIDTTAISLGEASKFNENANLDEVVVLPYSSGTTGLSKGVMHSHKSFIGNAVPMTVDTFSEPCIFPTTADLQEILPIFIPFYHIYGLSVLLQNSLSLGCKTLSVRKYDVNKFLELISKHKATFLSFVPLVVVQMANHPAANPSSFESVRVITCGASSVGSDDIQRLLKKAPNAKILQGYGMTEGIVSTDALEILDYKTVGFPLPNVEMKVVAIDDSSYTGLPVGESGEIFFRGPNIMKGYLNNTKATSETITEDGWLRTGDIGYYDKNGAFYIIDRLKELIKVNAFQVAPAELESLLRNHADILEAVVLGIPHPKYGEVPKAFVVRRPESKLTENDVKDYVSQNVIKYKQLTGGVQFLDSIPKNTTGKILRREIRRLYL